MDSHSNHELNRRYFIRQSAAAWAGINLHLLATEPPSVKESSRDTLDPDIVRNLDLHRPSRLERLPSDFRARVGATHVAGKYHLTSKPFLLEGAEKLLELGTQLGKFWFTPGNIAGSYPFNHQWGKYKSLADLAQSDYFKQLFTLPFRTVILETHTPIEEGWIRPDLPASFYEKITHEFYEVTAYFYKTYRDRDLTIVLQHWEGDWLLRRRGGELWNPPPSDWPVRCRQMVQWLKARQEGVNRARREFGASVQCCVAHAAEVNRVTDLWNGIPTMTEHVLPQVELDLVSYSAYDGMKDRLTLWKCLAEIRRHAKTGPLFGNQAIYIGEVGIPENDQPERIVERLDEFMGVFLAAQVKYIVHWELYCNEFSRQADPATKTPVKNPALVRGFWLVKPDGSLSQSGQYFNHLWQKAK